MTERNWNAFSVEISDHVAAVTLLGPGKGNAMGHDFWTECPQLFAELDADPEVRAILLTGSGKHFPYGLDLAAMGGEFAPLAPPPRPGGLRPPSPPGPPRTPQGPPGPPQGPTPYLL